MLTEVELHRLEEILVLTTDSLNEGLRRIGFHPASRKEEDAIQDALAEETGLQSCMGCGVWVYELDVDFCPECAD